MWSWAVIFDWDGVVLDSACLHEKAWTWLAQKRGKALPTDFFLRNFGMRNERAITGLLRWRSKPDELHRLIQAKERFYRRLLKKTGATPLPGVVKWLKLLRIHRVPCAIASSTPRLNIDCALKIMGLKAFFTAITAAEDVTHGKPDPDVFLLAARKLNMLPERCVVFEDAPVGIEAGLAAGMKVVAVTTTHPPALLVRAHRVVQRLDQLRFLDVEGWFELGRSRERRRLSTISGSSSSSDPRLFRGSTRRASD